MSFQQFLSILLARRKLILKVFFGVVITTLVVSLILPKQYTASATVLIDVKSPDPVMGMYLPAMAMPGYMATQNDIITSDRVARRVVQMLGFDKVPELVEAWKEQSEGKGTLEGYYAELLQKKLDVKPSRESNVLEIAFTGTEPKFAAAVANAFAKAYIDTNVELKVEPAKQYADWFVERSKQVRDKLEKAQAALSAYQQEKGIVSVDERLDVENARLNELSSQLTLLQAQRSEAQSRQHEARSSIETNPDVMNNPVIQNLRATVATTEAKLHLDSDRLGKNYPQIKQEQAELDTLKSKLASEMANVVSSLKTNTQVSTQKVSDVQAALEAQKKRVLDLKKQRDEVSVLQKDVESAQHDYDAVNQRLAQSNLESQNQQTNIVVLTPATEPTDPSKPKVLLNMLVSIFLGTMLSVGSALMMELMDRRIRSQEDLAQLGIPVLGELLVDRSSTPRWQFWRKKLAAA